MSCHSEHFANFKNRRSLIFPSLEKNARRANALSARAPLYRCDRMLSIISTQLLVASMMSQCKVQIVHLGPSLSRLCASVMC
ncbi:unnamed protein product [Penicillium salamii]|uniref:Uncharacterized protein n=1 Tax=Penicillium salamii TaxID=1612424 RepID=A0A9W4J4W0_9EURO|nr:unnamed protein product [Penicillium salamii]CAG8372335.1 unnamed protein product [Penicillium salamii]CAG8373470.1 unnamed protein product [Penicillium salamii]CAG8638578.1 unnamed protein product [Penicillium salamii]CAG8889664.1 unnamed protein product [Penicillium salamii]